MEKKRFAEEYATLIPKVAGVYRYYDDKKTLLYIGKAKNLKNRISSYFTGEQTRKTMNLVEQIHHIEWTVTPSEHDAFLMENSLIKHFQPPYNIQLKDDKSYPYVVIKNEHFPRVFLTRRRLRDGSTYLGPYTNIKRIRALLEVIKKYIPLRSCNLNLNPKVIATKKYKVCLDYHIGKCKGPCEGLQAEEDYAQNIEIIKNILRGNFNSLIEKLEKDRDRFAAVLNFEMAQKFQQQIEEIKEYKVKNSVVSNGFYHLDIITASDAPDVIYINYMMVEEGQIIQSHNLFIEKKLNENPEEVLAHALIFFRQKFKSDSKEVISPYNLYLNEKDLEMTIPKAGPKKKFLELSEKNVYYYRLQEEKKLSANLKNVSENKSLELIQELKKNLHLNSVPYHIECFDNSNLQGSSPVSAMVSFKNGLASKKDYRHYHIKTVKGIDDYASMREVIFRRYSRLLKEKLDLPNLIIIDGGKGQLSAAIDSLKKLKLENEIDVIAIAEREERIFKAFHSEPILLPYNSEVLLFLRKIRNEVHDYGLRFHRKIRSKNAFKNILEEIPGIGQKSAENLLRKFRSVEQIKKQSKENLAKVVGPARAQSILDYFAADKKF